MGLKGKVRFACLATLALTLTFSLTTTTALADQAAPRSDNPNAYTSQSRYTNQVFWWTPPIIQASKGSGKMLLSNT